MARPALRIEVSSKDRKELQSLVSSGVQQVRVVLRALALLQLAKGVGFGTPGAGENARLVFERSAGAGAEPCAAERRRRRGR
jgi:hypothetical protein